MTRDPAYTDEQKVAIKRHGVSIALDAGAGCGKTFVLTERFLDHLAPADDAAGLHELVAITFTDAAAREMRKRVRDKCLQRLSQGADGEGDYWLRLLRSLDAARVSTIHAFCSNLVRAHALELGIDPGFRVLDQAAADVLLSEATDDRLRALLERRDEDAVHLAAEFGLRGLKQRLAPLRDHAGAALDPWLTLSSEEIVRRWRSYHQHAVAPLELDEIRRSRRVDDVLAGMRQATPGPEAAANLAELERLLGELREGEATDELLERIVALARTQGVCGRKSDWPTPEAKKAYGDACKALRETIRNRQAWREADVQRAAAQLGQRLARVAREVFGAYEERKREDAALDFDDLQREARRLLTEPAFRDTQRRVRREIKLLLVDEFQDTDRLQADLVNALVGDGLSDGRLFFVGDYKQSIYRFRGAQPQVFRDLRERTPAAGRLPLSMNFRSQPAVLEMVNALFGPKFAPDYTPLRPSRPQAGPRPGVEFLWTGVSSEASAEASRGREAATIAARVAELLEDPTPRVAVQGDDGRWTARRVKAGDIAILFRALGDVQHYEQALRDAGVDYHLVGGHAFYSQQEVYDVLNLLRSVVSACDEVSLAGALRSPLFALEDETLLWLAREGGSLNAGLLTAGSGALGQRQQERVAAARQTLTELRQMRGAASTAEVLRVAMERTGYDATLLSEFLGERKLANLEKIIEQARAADEARPGDLDAFVRQLSEFIARQPKEALAATTAEDANVVRLMTVHNAKGLEFPVVIVADLDRKTRGDSSSAAFDPELGPLVKPPDAGRDDPIGLNLYKTVQKAHDRDELTRLFYVACTRAADYLILSSAVADIQKPQGEWLKSLADGFNLQTGAPLDGADGAPLAIVNQRDDARRASGATTRAVDVPKLLDKALASAGRGQPVDQLALPLAVDPAHLRTFSVSRLTGRVRYRPERRRADDPLLQRPTEVDPLGFGTLVHAVLERLDPANPSGVREWCEALAPLHVGRHADRAADDAAELVTRFLESPQWAALGSAQVERELEFLMRWPPGDGPHDAQLQGYIDCLYADAQGAWRVLDYKTNNVTAAGVPNAAEQYRVQLAVYALAVEQALGARPVALELCFLRPGAVHTFAWDDAARAAAIRDVSNAIREARLAATNHDDV